MSLHFAPGVNDAFWTLASGSNAQQQQQQQQQQLYALQVTCLKSWLLALDAVQPLLLQQQEQQQQQQQQELEWSTCSLKIAVAAARSAGAVASTCDAALHHWKGCMPSNSSSSLELLLSNSASSSSSSSSSSSMSCPQTAAAAAPWVALLARCLFMSAAALQMLAATPAAGGTAAETSGKDSMSGSSIDILPNALRCEASRCLKVLSCHLRAAGLSAEVLQQLQSQQASAQEHLQSLYAGRAASGATVSSAVAQQLQAFAQAVAGRIPFSYACNNLTCVSLAQRSELLLVGGKSCVCARCKAAR
jgi:hypothetical protein